MAPPLICCSTIFFCVFGLTRIVAGGGFHRVNPSAAQNGMSSHVTLKSSNAGASTAHYEVLSDVVTVTKRENHQLAILQQSTERESPNVLVATEDLLFANTFPGSLQISGVGSSDAICFKYGVDVNELTTYATTQPLRYKEVVEIGVTGNSLIVELFLPMDPNLPCSDSNLLPNQDPIIPTKTGKVKHQLRGRPGVEEIGVSWRAETMKTP
eukprot:jgi/Bigna1/83470/fgenesh1_pg.109_\